MLLRKFTPENITELKEFDVFVFGSNTNGNHSGGAAKLAKEKFGAKEGVGEGLSGQSYALPTLDKNMNKVSLSELSNSIDRLYDFAIKNKKFNFWVTKVGCGIAGFDEKEITDIFKSKETPYNVFLPKEFTVIKGFKGFNSDMRCKNFQYESNSEFTYKDKIAVCSSGFHFCENPLNVLKFYKHVDGVYAEVEGSGEIDSENLYSKHSVSNLKIKSKIKFMDFINLSLNFTLKKTTWLVNKALELTLAGQDSNTLAGQDSNTLAGRNSNTLAGRNSNTLAGQDRNTLAGRNSNTLAGRNSNTLAGRNSNTLAGQNYNTLAGQNYNTLSGQDRNTLAGQNYNTLAGQDYNTLAGQNYNTLAGQDRNTLAGQDSNTLAGRNSNTLAGQDYNTLAGQDSNTLAGQDSNTLAGRNRNTLAGQDYNTLAGRDGNIIACRCGNTITVTGENNIVTCANNSKVKAKKGNIIVFVEYSLDNNIINHKTIQTNSEYWEENCFYSFKEGKLVKVE